MELCLEVEAYDYLLKDEKTLNFGIVVYNLTFLFGLLALFGPSYPFQAVASKS